MDQTFLEIPKHCQTGFLPTQLPLQGNFTFHLACECKQHKLHAVEILHFYRTHSFCDVLRESGYARLTTRSLAPRLSHNVGAETTPASLGSLGTRLDNAMPGKVASKEARKSAKKSSRKWASDGLSYLVPSWKLGQYPKDVCELANSAPGGFILCDRLFLQTTHVVEQGTKRMTENCSLVPRLL